MDNASTFDQLVRRLGLSPGRSRWSGTVDGVEMEARLPDESPSDAVIKASLGKASPQDLQLTGTQLAPTLAHADKVRGKVQYQTGTLTLTQLDRMGAEAAEAWVRALAQCAKDEGWLKEESACAMCGQPGRFLYPGDPIFLCGDCLPQVEARRQAMELRGPGFLPPLATFALLVGVAACLWGGAFALWDWGLGKFNDGSFSADVRIWMLLGSVMGACVGWGASGAYRLSSLGCHGRRKWVLLMMVLPGCVLGEMIHQQLDRVIFTGYFYPVHTLTHFFDFWGAYREGDWLLIAGAAIGILMAFVSSLPQSRILHSMAVAEWRNEKRVQPDSGE